jgi:hypothetical protein
MNWNHMKDLHLAMEGMGKMEPLWKFGQDELNSWHVGGWPQWRERLKRGVPAVPGAARLIRAFPASELNPETTLGFQCWRLGQKALRLILSWPG